MAPSLTTVASALILGTAALGCGGSGAPLGVEHTGGYNLGPVEWTGSFPNACAPYPAAIQAITGTLLAGLSNEVAATGNHCDACIQINTGAGQTLVARVITYGVSNAPGDADLSAAAFNAIHQNEFPRSMTWHITTCPGSDPLHIQFQTLANVDWTSLWVRNPRIAIERVEVKSSRHASFFAMRLGTDGTWTDDGGFGAGAFTLRVVGVNGATFEQTFSGFNAGDLLACSGNL